jgi:hypothetical protein
MPTRAEVKRYKPKRAEGSGEFARADDWQGDGAARLSDSALSLGEFTPPSEETMEATRKAFAMQSDLYREIGALDDRAARGRRARKARDDWEGVCEDKR